MRKSYPRKLTSRGDSKAPSLSANIPSKYVKAMGLVAGDLIFFSYDPLKDQMIVAKHDIVEKETSLEASSMDMSVSDAPAGSEFE